MLLWPLIDLGIYIAAVEMPIVSQNALLSASDQNPGYVRNSATISFWNFLPWSLQISRLSVAWILKKFWLVLNACLVGYFFFLNCIFHLFLLKVIGIVKPASWDQPGNWPSRKFYKHVWLLGTTTICPTTIIIKQQPVIFPFPKNIRWLPSSLLWWIISASFGWIWQISHTSGKFFAEKSRTSLQYYSCKT